MHTRFEHCIGVGHLAASYALILKQNQPELEVDNWHLKLLRIAGLTHDLGHGPYSHTFDNVLSDNSIYGINNKWNHENMSSLLLEKIICDKGIN